jgi:phosphoribosylanthranilate isomerase
VREAADLAAVAAFEGVADRLLLDAKPPPGAALPGGNGLPFDWRLLQRLDNGLDYMLSGGIDEANVDAALSLAAPTGIDVSSGVESAPGVKDPARIEALFRAVRAALDDRSRSPAQEVGHEQAG